MLGKIEKPVVCFLTLILIMLSGGDVLQVYGQESVSNNDIYLDEMLETDSIAVQEYCGYVELPDNTHSVYEKGMSPTVDYSKDLPRVYDSRQTDKITSVKQQNPWGNCWSFATMAALESSLLSANEDVKPDLSEYHLCYFNYTSVVDPLKGLSGDGVRYNGTFRQYLNAGGNVLVAYHALANWTGAVDENVTGYPMTAAELSQTVETAFGMDSIHLQQFFKINKNDIPDIKKAVMDYGAVTASFYYNELFYNSETYAYYNNSIKQANHAVVIVGWDDDFSRNNFNNMPLNDGAWLIKNSWGETFGNGGYQWLSYEDVSVTEAMCVLVGENANRYGNNYQYDGSYMDAGYGYNRKVKAANVFNVQSDTREVLKAVSFQVDSTNVDYIIQIYRNLAYADNPESGQACLQQTVQGSTRYQGYYTVELPEMISLESGDSFSVVIEFSKDGYDDNNIWVVAENSTMWNNTYYTASAQPNQSFICYNEANWVDFGVLNNCNLRIKAFTEVNLQPDPVKVSGIEIEEGPQNLIVGEEKQLHAHVLPLDADEQAVSWASSDEKILTVDPNGNIKALNKGNAIITAVSVEGGYEAGTEVKVHNRINIEPSEMELAIGERGSLQVTVNNQPADNRNFSWLSEDEGSVKLTGNQLYVQTSCMGINKIECINPEDSMERAECIVTTRTPFVDISTSEWFYPFVCDAYELNIMQGKSESSFMPDDRITRAEFAMIIYAMEGKPVTVFDNHFDDVDSNDWFYNAVNWCYDNKIVSGYGNRKFGSQDSITREQLALMLYKYSMFKNYDTAVRGNLIEDYIDGQIVSAYAQNAVEWAVEKGMIAGKGNGKLDPKNSASRAEAATIFSRFLEENQIN